MFSIKASKGRWPLMFVGCALILSAPRSLRAQESAGRATANAFGVHAAIGTDIELGLGFGGGVTLLVPQPQMRFDIEAGGQIFLAHSEYTEEDFHTYTETTDLFVLAVRFNLLFDYKPRGSGLYYLIGTGAAAVSVDWEERSDTDTSLGEPLPNGGSKQDADGVAGALVANFGAGMTFGGGFDARLELPTLIFLNGVGEAATFAPTVVLSAGLRF